VSISDVWLRDCPADCG